MFYIKGCRYLNSQFSFGSNTQFTILHNNALLMTDCKNFGKFLVLSFLTQDFLINMAMGSFLDNFWTPSPSRIAVPPMQGV